MVLQNTPLAKSLGDKLFELADVLHGFRSKIKMLSMYVAYFDESHDGQKRSIFAVAGWLDTAANWQRFTDAWSNILERDRLDDFHMSDCEAEDENGLGVHPNYRGWSKDRRFALIKDLIQIILNSSAKAFGAIVLMEDYQRVLADCPSDRKDIFGNGDPYQLVFRWGIQETCSAINVLPAKERVAFIFDNNRESQDVAMKYYRAIMDDNGAVYTSRMGSLTFDSRKRAVPLQAADVLAREAMKHLRDPEKPRRSFDALRHRMGALTYFDERLLRELLRLTPTKPISDLSS